MNLNEDEEEFLGVVSCGEFFTSELYDDEAQRVFADMLACGFVATSPSRYDELISLTEAGKAALYGDDCSVPRNH